VQLGLVDQVVVVEHQDEALGETGQFIDQTRQQRLEHATRQLFRRQVAAGGGLYLPQRRHAIA
jgi:hypothetical protein